MSIYDKKLILWASFVYMAEGWEVESWVYSRASLLHRLSTSPWDCSQKVKALRSLAPSLQFSCGSAKLGDPTSQTTLSLGGMTLTDPERPKPAGILILFPRHHEF